jgi:hypothetical protein
LHKGGNTPKEVETFVPDLTDGENGKCGSEKWKDQQMNKNPLGNAAGRHRSNQPSDIAILEILTKPT